MKVVRLHSTAASPIIPGMASNRVAEAHAVAGMQEKEKAGQEQLVSLCLAAFVETGTIDLSLDQLAKHVGISKRMLVHYFGTREAIEAKAMTLLEEKLRAQFAPESFPAGVSPQTVVKALWERTTAPESRGVLLLIMDLSRRASNGSARAKAFSKSNNGCGSNCSCSTYRIGRR